MDSKKMKMVYTIAERENGKSYWTRIGVGFVNQDGSINLKLDAIPMGGQQIQVRDWDPERRPDGARPPGGGGPSRYSGPTRDSRDAPSSPHEPAEFGGLA